MKFIAEPPVCAGFFHRVQILALKIFHEGQLKPFGLRDGGTYHDRNTLQPGFPGGPEAPLSCDDRKITVGPR